MKRVKWILLPVMVLMLFWGLYGFLTPSYASVLEANWGVKLPVSACCREVYRQDTGPSFHGDGVRYHVFSCINSAAIDELLPWSAEEGHTLEWSQTAGEERQYRSYSQSAQLWLHELDVPETQLPVYESCVCWYSSAPDNSQLILFWDPGSRRLYIVENLI